MARARPSRGVVVALAALIAAPAALAADPPQPWDGANPFSCVLQQAGFNATGPNPEADPYCIEFDKRARTWRSSASSSSCRKEPARVAAASPKCFYFQSDHWRGSLVQDDAGTKTYEWDGHYFFDKANGEGGVWVTNFNIAGQTSDPRLIPGFPRGVQAASSAPAPAACAPATRSTPTRAAWSAPAARARASTRAGPRLELHHRRRPRQLARARPAPRPQQRRPGAPRARPASASEARLPALVHPRPGALSGRAAQRPQRRARRVGERARDHAAVDLTSPPLPPRGPGRIAAHACAAACAASVWRCAEGRHASTWPDAAQRSSSAYAAAACAYVAVRDKRRVRGARALSRYLGRAR